MNIQYIHPADQIVMFMLTAFQQFETLNYAAELEALATRRGEIRPLSENACQMSKTNVCSELRNVSPQPCSSEELAARRDLIALIRRSYKMGLFTAAQGTYSTRLSDGSFIITPLHADPAYLEADDLVRIQDGAKEPGKTPDADVLLHQKIYDKNPKIGPWCLLLLIRHSTRERFRKAIFFCAM